MKKILFLIPLFALLMGVYSCDDNEDFCKPHILTSEEMDTLRKTDSINEAMKKAPLELNYTVSMIDGEEANGVLEIDNDAIGKKFGISGAQVVSMLKSGEIAHSFFVGDNEYTGDCTANGIMGYWMDGQGNPVKYATDDCAWYLQWEESDGNISYGNYSGHNKVGDAANLTFKYVYQERVALIHVAMSYVDVSTFNDPEQRPGTTPADLTKDLTITKTFDNEYSEVYTDVHDELCNAFNMTTHEIQHAVAIGTLNVYIGEETEGQPSYTGSVAGMWWISSDGKPVEWSNGCVFSTLYADRTNSTITIGLGNHESGCKAGTTVNYKMIISNGTTRVTYNVTAVIN